MSMDSFGIQELSERVIQNLDFVRANLKAIIYENQLLAAILVDEIREENVHGH